VGAVAIKRSRSGLKKTRSGHGHSKLRRSHVVFWTQELSDKLIEVVKTGIVLINSQGEVLFTNQLAQDLLGRSDDSLIGASIEVLFLPEDARFLLPNIMKLNILGKGFEGEALLCRRNGDTFFVHLSTALYRGGSPERDLIVFTFQDITHLKRMEKEHLDSERFAGLGMMTDQISHQIRNPIVSIGGFALRLAKDQISPEEYSQYSRIIHSEARRLEHIIDRLAEFTSVHVIRYERLTLSQLFRETAQVLDGNLDAERVSLAFPDSRSLSDKPLFGDLSLLRRALECVIRNGVEAVEGEGQVVVQGEFSDNQVLIRVTDDGGGVAAENVPFVFDPFFSMKSNQVGLGLTMARRVIQEHRGRIELNSQLGKGTSVLLALPGDRRRPIRTKPI
jgi:PAS domain S-box-containing protein